MAVYRCLNGTCSDLLNALETECIDVIICDVVLIPTVCLRPPLGCVPERVHAQPDERAGQDPRGVGAFGQQPGPRQNLGAEKLERRHGRAT